MRELVVTRGLHQVALLGVSAVGREPGAQRVG